MPPFSESETLVFPETSNSPESLFLRKSLSTPEIPSAQPPTPKRPVKHPADECTHNLVLFQNLLKEMKEIKRFTNSSLQIIRKNNLNKLISAYLKIRSIRNKFDSLADII